MSFPDQWYNLIFLTDVSLQPSQVIFSLGSVIATKPPLPSYVRKACSFLLGRQLLRPGGIRGLCAALFGEEVGQLGGDVSLEKLENFATAVRTVPPSVPPQVRPGTIDSTVPDHTTRSFLARSYLSYSHS